MDPFSLLHLAKAQNVSECPMTLVIGACLCLMIYYQRLGVTKIQLYSLLRRFEGRWVMKPFFESPTSFSPGPTVVPLLAVISLVLAF